MPIGKDCKQICSADIVVADHSIFTKGTNGNLLLNYHNNDTMNINQVSNHSKKYFNKIAYDYDNAKIPEPTQCYPIILDMIGNTVHSIADIGCGTGTMLRMIIEKYPTITNIVGVDLSEQMILEAQKKSDSSISFFVGDVENLSLEDNTYDLVLCMHSFHHYPHPQKALAEMYRITKNDGHVIIVENYRPTVIRFFKNLALLVFRYVWGDIKVYSPKELVQLMAQTNFEQCYTELITPKSFICVGNKYAKEP